MIRRSDTCCDKPPDIMNMLGITIQIWYVQDRNIIPANTAFFIFDKIFGKHVNVASPILILHTSLTTCFIGFAPSQCRDVMMHLDLGGNSLTCKNTLLFQSFVYDWPCLPSLDHPSLLQVSWTSWTGWTIWISWTGWTIWTSWTGLTQSNCRAIVKLPRKFKGWREFSAGLPTVSRDQLLLHVAAHQRILTCTSSFCHLEMLKYADT